MIKRNARRSFRKVSKVMREIIKLTHEYFSILDSQPIGLHSTTWIKANIIFMFVIDTANTYYLIVINYRYFFRIFFLE